MRPEGQNKLGCYIMFAIAVAILAIAAWLAFGMQRAPRATPATANLPAPSDPQAGS